MLNGMVQKVDEQLWRRGFRVAEVRVLMRAQLLITGISLLAGFALGWINEWLMWFGVGAVMSTFNFYSLAKFIQQVVFLPWSGAMMAKLLFRFYGRLMLTGLILFGLIVWLEVSVSAVVAGLSTAVAVIAIWGITRLAGHKVKEA